MGVATYPGGIKSFGIDLVDGVDYPLAAHTILPPSVEIPQ